MKPGSKSINKGGQQIAIAGADIDDSVDDGRRGVDDVLRVVAPENVERGGRRARGYPCEIGSPAELSPGIGGRSRWG